MLLDNCIDDHNIYSSRDVFYTIKGHKGRDLKSRRVQTEVQLRFLRPLFLWYQSPTPLCVWSARANHIDAISFSVKTFFLLSPPLYVLYSITRVCVGSFFSSSR